jgi:hypothetical protein
MSERKTFLLPHWPMSCHAALDATLLLIVDMTECHRIPTDVFNT